MPKDFSQLNEPLSWDPRTGRQAGGWTNKLIWGDNKLVLASLKNGPLRKEIEDAGGLKLVYIDPPFDVGADFAFQLTVGDRGDELTKKPSVIEEVAYRDTWGNGKSSYISMLMERMQLIADLLHEKGSVFVHMGANVNHLVRCACDDIFGGQNFRNEIILPGRAVKNLQQQFESISRLQVRHDVLLWYSKSSDVRFSQFWVQKHDAGDPEGHWHHFWSTADRPAMRYELFDHTPSSGQWVWKRERALKAVANYERYRCEAGGRTLVEYWRDTGKSLEFIRPSPDDRKPQYWREPAEERLADTLWAGVPIYASQTGYPTEKNVALLENVISLASNASDLIGDFFCGSGTTMAVAEKLGRKWIGCDLGRFAIHTSRKRLIGVQRQLKAEGKPYRSFEILTLGRYERQYFVGIDPTLPGEQRQAISKQKEEQYLTLILNAYKAERLLQTPPFHGRKGDALVVVGPVDAPVTHAQVAEVVEACRRLRVSRADALGFEFEMGLAPHAQDEARARGVSLALRYIPREVFDKRAVEKGQVAFYDVAYIEVQPRVKARSVTVSLKDFAVYYRQDALDALAERLKNGGSKVTVDAGQVVKVVKDKKGVVTREVLTKTWTDWIDYWAVDFDFESRQETIRIMAPDANGRMVERQQWTGGYIFENEWQAFRTRKDRSLELTSASHEYPQKGRYKIAVKVIDIFGNDTTKVVQVVV